MSNKAHETIQNPCTLWGCGPRELMEVELGARYRQMLARACMADGDSEDIDAMEAELSEYNGKYGVHDMHDELTSAKEEMEMQLRLLAAKKYTVEEPRQTPSGGWYFHRRKPRPGDLVMVPQWFIGTGRDETEPEEDRPDSPFKYRPVLQSDGTKVIMRTPNHTRSDEEAQFRAPRLDRDTHGEWLSLADIFDDRNARYLALASDKWGCGRPEAALRILCEEGRIQFDGDNTEVSLDGTVRRMCEDQGITTTAEINGKIRLVPDWYRLWCHAENDARKVKPKRKPGYLYLIRKGIRVWVEVEEKLFVDQNYRVSEWLPVPENPTTY